MKLLLFFWFLFGISHGKIVIFYGSFESSSCDSFPDLGWDQCVNKCDEESNCYTSLQSAFSSSQLSCSICGWGELQGISYPSVETVIKIALKTEDGSDCVSNLEKLKNGKINELQLCDSGAKIIREKYTMCYRRMLTSQAIRSFTKAQKECDTIKFPNILGLENEEERLKFSNYLTKSGENVNGTYIWLSSLFVKNNDGVIISWNDSYLSGFGVFKWTDGHPKNGFECVTILAGTGELYSIECDGSSVNIESFGVICGKLMQ
ncbi:unnamed protein product [Caenorhabditis angaria]|uniref:C-type lectin domain-containing protein n=1 Tax=Caenorhabditis angaria TaxID=860376 RepID=A0A9P1ID97_9PELO|nr:unnamed protein product [Caenorhabditis angaria]